MFKEAVPRTELKSYVEKMLNDCTSQFEINIIGSALLYGIYNWCKNNLSRTNFATNLIEKYNLCNDDNAILYRTMNKDEILKILSDNYTVNTEEIESSVYLRDDFLDRYFSAFTYFCSDAKINITETEGILNKYATEEAFDAIANIAKKYLCTNGYNKKYLIEHIYINLVQRNMSFEWIKSFKFPEFVSKYILSILKPNDSKIELSFSSWYNFNQKERITILKKCTISKEYYTENIERLGFVYKYLRVNNPELKNTEVKLLQQVLVPEESLEDYIKQHDNISAKNIVDQLNLNYFLTHDDFYKFCWKKINKEVPERILNEFLELDLNNDETYKITSRLIRNLLSFTECNLDEDIEREMREKIAVITISNVFSSHKKNSGRLYGLNPDNLYTDATMQEVIKKLLPHNSYKELSMLLNALDNPWDCKGLWKILDIKKINNLEFEISFDEEILDSMPYFEYDIKHLLKKYFMPKDVTISNIDPFDKIFIKMLEHNDPIYKYLIQNFKFNRKDDSINENR